MVPDAIWYVIGKDTHDYRNVSFLIRKIVRRFDSSFNVLANCSKQELIKLAPMLSLVSKKREVGNN
jgi:hypothetical protein